MEGHEAGRATETMTGLPDKRERLRIALLGASFDTGNLGINALAESTVKILLHQWPEAEIILFGSALSPEHVELSVGERTITVQSVPVRFSKALTLPYHFLWFTLYGLLARLLPWRGIRRRLFARNVWCRILHEVDLAVDITGGDSFSDIYGARRFILGFLRKWLVLLYRKDLVMMPQTYGPFRTSRCRRLARFILKRSRRVYTRDRAGLEYLDRLLGSSHAEGRAAFAPDVAFVLDARKPPSLSELGDHSNSSVLVGLNVSGLIYRGGYTGRNEFELKVDYRALIDGIVDLLLQKDGTRLLLVPHVVSAGEPGANIEDDLIACRDVYERLAARYPNRLLVAADRYDHAQIKYVIGMCDFFIGTRMHSCIAALSQCVPAVGLAYSKKFEGVFETVGVEELVVDMRHVSLDEAIRIVDGAFDSRERIVRQLENTVPPVQQQVMTLLEGIAS